MPAPGEAGCVLVTGAGGFIGGAVARDLAARPGLRVRAGTRDGRALGGEILACKLDVCAPASLADALRGCAAVVHCAVGGARTTVTGTRLLLQAARAAGVPRVIHFSSIAVYGQAQGAVTETAPLVSEAGRGYAHWKAAAEAACRAAARDGTEVAVLRPAIVYGPGSEMWTLRPARRLLAGWGALGALGEGICNPVHVRDVAAACLAALRAPAIDGCEAFNIAGPAQLTWNAWHAGLAAALGCPPQPAVPPSAWRRRSLAALPFKALARLLPSAGHRLARRIMAAPSPSELALFALAATYPAERAAARLGWQPRVGLEEGMAESVDWLRAIGVAR